MTSLDHSNDEKYSKALYPTLLPKGIASKALIDFNVWIIFLIHHHKVAGNHNNANTPMICLHGKEYCHS